MEQKKFENNPNSGTLHATKVKKNPKEPDYFGDFKLDLSTVDVEDGIATFKLSGWKKQSKNGNTFLSIAVNTWKPEGQQAKPQQQSNNDEGLDDDIPF